MDWRSTASPKNLASPWPSLRSTMTRGTATHSPQNIAKELPDSAKKKNQSRWYLKEATIPSPSTSKRYTHSKTLALSDKIRTQNPGHRPHWRWETIDPHSTKRQHQNIRKPQQRWHYYQQTGTSKRQQSKTLAIVYESQDWDLWYTRSVPRKMATTTNKHITRAKHTHLLQPKQFCSSLHTASTTPGLGTTSGKPQYHRRQTGPTTGCNHKACTQSKPYRRGPCQPPSQREYGSQNGLPTRKDPENRLRTANS